MYKTLSIHSYNVNMQLTCVLLQKDKRWEVLGILLWDILEIQEF